MPIRVENVRLLPGSLETDLLYVSEEFETAAHLCACGCGTKVITPLGPTDWAVWSTPDGASVFPSIGNWQLPCRSHYWIWSGQIFWAEQWTDEEVNAGREMEREKDRQYFESLFREGDARNDT